MPAKLSRVATPHKAQVKCLLLSSQCRRTVTAKIYGTTLKFICQPLHVCVCECVCIAEVFAATRHIWLSYPTEPPSSPAGYPQVPQQYQALMVMQAALQLECMQAHTHTHTLLRHSTLNTLCILSILHSTLDEEYQQQQQQAANWPQGSLVRWFRHTIKKMMQDPATFEYSYRCV